MPKDKLNKLADVMNLAAQKARSLSDTGKADGEASEVSSIAVVIDLIAARLRQAAARAPENDPTQTRAKVTAS